MAFARFNDIVVHYRDEGRPEGPAIVFANSLGTDFRIWDEVVAQLGGDFRILRYDKRGHGLSEATPAPYAMDTLVADLDGLMDALAIENALVVGLSVGGVIAQGLASRHRNRVKALVLMDTAHRIGTREMWDARIAAIEAGGIGAISAQILERWFTPAFRDPSNAAFAGYSAMLLRTPQAGYLGTCAALRDADYTEATSRLAVPVLCVVGDTDGSTPPDLVRSTADLIAGSRFEIITDAGHLPPIEQPEATAALIRDFAMQHVAGQERS